MESCKKPAASSSLTSFANELFGPNDSSSSTGVFGSIFASPSKLITRRDDARSSEVVDKKNYDTLSGRPDNSSQASETDEEGQSSRNKTLNAIFEGQRGLAHHPCNLSSSIYYGGQDMYFSPQASQSSSSYKKGVDDDDPHSASRGDWWQGSVYY